MRFHQKPTELGRILLIQSSTLLFSMRFEPKNEKEVAIGVSLGRSRAGFNFLLCRSSDELDNDEYWIKWTVVMFSGENSLEKSLSRLFLWFFFSVHQFLSILYPIRCVYGEFPICEFICVLCV